MWNIADEISKAIIWKQDNCSFKLKLFISFSSSMVCLKTTVCVLVFFIRNVNMIFISLRQRQSFSHEVKSSCKNLQRFSFKSLKPFCLSSEQGLK